MHKQKKYRLVLHIGAPKTGSTAIQAFLNENEKSLASCRTLFPRTGRLRNQHYYLKQAFVPGGGLYNDFTLWDELSDELSQGDYDNAIVSAEGFSLLRDFSLLRERLNNYFDEIHVVVYLRHQYGFVNSIYRTKIKNRERLCCDFATFIDDYLDQKELLNYTKIIAGLYGSFEHDNVHIKSYDEVKKTGSVVDDLCATLKEIIPGLDDRVAVKNDQLVHETSPDVGLDLVLRCNRLVPYYDGHWRTIREILTVSSSLFDKSMTTQAFVLPEHVKNEFVSKIQSLNEETFRDYGINCIEQLCNLEIHDHKTCLEEHQRIEKQKELIDNLSREVRKFINSENTLCGFNSIYQVPLAADLLEMYRCIFNRNHIEIANLRAQLAEEKNRVKSLQKVKSKWWGKIRSYRNN